MKFKEFKNQIKEEQKQLANQIKNFKKERKKTSTGYISGLDQKRSTYRHKHIVYCQLFNNTPYKQIERSCHECPNQYILDRYTKEWYKVFEQFEHEERIAV